MVSPKVEFTFLHLLILVVILLITSRKLLHGVLLFIVLLPYERFYVTRVLSLNVKVAEWVALICIIVFIWHILSGIRKRMFVRSITTPLLIFALVNIVFLLVTIPHLIQYGNPLDFNSAGYRTLKVVFWCICSILTAFAVSYSIKTEQDLRRCVSVLLTATLALCAISLVALVIYLLGGKFATWTLIDRVDFVGIKASYSEPAYFAHYMSVVLPLAIMVFIMRAYKAGLFLSIFACFLLLLTNYFSFSTTGLAGGTLILILMPFVIRHYRLLSTGKGMRYIVTLLVFIYVVFLVSVFFHIDFVRITMMNYFDKLFRPDCRWAARVMGMRMFLDRPLMGFGPGNWNWYAEKIYMPQIMKETFVKPSYNCLYWEILVDLGMVGLLPFTWFFMSLFRGLSKGIFQTESNFLKAVLAGLILGFAALLGEYYVCFNFYRVHVWAYVGLALAAIRLAREEERLRQNSLSPEG